MEDMVKVFYSFLFPALFSFPVLLLPQEAPETRHRSQVPGSETRVSQHPSLQPKTDGGNLCPRKFVTELSFYTY
jgi:hypothetical protein